MTMSSNKKKGKNRKNEIRMLLAAIAISGTCLTLNGIRADAAVSHLAAQQKIYDLINHYKDPEDPCLVNWDEITDDTESQVKELKAIADETVKDCKSQYEKIMAINKYVGENISYTEASQGGDPYKVWTEKKANCAGHASLADALLELEGIPAQTVDGDCHQYVLSYDSGQKKWIFSDPTWKWYDMSAETSSKDAVHAVYDILINYKGLQLELDFHAVNAMDDCSENPVHAFWNDEYVSTENWTLSVTGVYKNVSEIDLSESELDGIPITEVGRFDRTAVPLVNYNTLINSVTSIKLPSSVTTIHSAALSSLKNLSSVSFYGDSELKEIGAYAFKGDTALKSVEINGNSLENIGEEAFKGDTSLSDITGINGKKLTSIGKQAFYNTGSLKEMDLSDTSLKEIPEEAFCYSGIASLALPETVTAIGKRAFAENSSLTKADLSATKITSVGEEAFVRDKGLSSVLFPVTLKKIESGGFAQCWALPEADLSKTALSSVGDNGFYNCKSLTYICLPETVTGIGTDVFRMNDSMKDTPVWTTIDTALSPEDLGYTKDNSGSFTGRLVGFAKKGETYGISFNGNGSDGGTAVSDAFYNGKEATLPECTYTKSGYTFIGWGKTADATLSSGLLQSGDTVTGATKTFYAVWRSNSSYSTYTLYLNDGTNNSLKTGTLSYKSGSVELPDAERDGYTFGGWYKNKACTDGPVDTISWKAMTARNYYYAKWISEKGDKCSHENTALKNVKTATCKEEGYTGDTVCSDCGETVKAGSVVAKTGNHSWDNGTVTTAATETKEGVKTFTCTVCNATKTESIAKLSHTHKWDNGSVTTKADCIHTGIKTYHCSGCSETKTEAIPVDAGNHTGKTEIRNAKSATCGADGYTGDTVCSDCGETVKAGSVVTKTGNHSWDNGTVTKTPDCIHTGIKTYHCSVCGAAKTEVIPSDAGNHTGNTEILNVREATCKEEGYTGDTVCADCKETLKAGSAIAKTGNHSWDNGTVTTAATESKEGVKTFTCTVCNATKTESIAKLSHTHVWDNGTITRKADCVHTGIKTYHCSGCSETKTETIPVDAGKHTGNTVIRNKKAAVCGEDGYTGDTVCSDCGAVLGTGEKIPASGKHVYGEGIATKEADCSSEGTTSYTCAICGRTKTETIEKDADVHTGNTLIKNKKAATYFATGYTGDTVCADCGAVLAEGNTVSKLVLTVPGSLKLKAGKKCCTVSFKKGKNSSGTQVQYSVSSKMTKVKSKSVTGTSCKLTKLTSKKYIYVRIRAYKKSGSKTVYSKWSSIKKVKIK